MKEENFSDKFQESALSYASRMKQKLRYPSYVDYPWLNLSGTLDDHLEKLRDKYNFIDPSHEVMYSFLIHQQMDKFYRIQKWLVEKCESPIEVAMGFALWIIGNEYDYDFELLSICDYRHERCSYLLTPQVTIGDYRVDFLLQYRETLPKMEDGVIIRDVTSHKKMAIECDGHDFHERTKKQASRDKLKDRVLQSTGYLVFRFSGSDIWKDVFGCAEQAFETLTSATHEEAERLSQA